MCMGSPSWACLSCPHRVTADILNLDEDLGLCRPLPCKGSNMTMSGCGFDHGVDALQEGVLVGLQVFA